jgi:hypothetical protein
MVNLLDGATGAVLQTFANPTPNPPYGQFGTAIAVSGGSVLVGDPGDNEVHVFDAATGTLQHTITFNEISFGHALAVLGADVLVTSIKGGAFPETRIRRYDVATGTPLGLFAAVQGPLEDRGTLTVVDGNVLLGLTEFSGAVHLLDGSTGTVLRTFLPPEAQQSVLFGSLVRATSDMVFVRGHASVGEVAGRMATYIFDLASGVLLRTIRDHAGEPFFYPPQQLAVLGDRTIVGRTVYAVCGGAVACGPCETCGPFGSCVLAPHPTCQQMTPTGAFTLAISDPLAPGGGLVRWKGRGQLAAGGPPAFQQGNFLFGIPHVDTDYGLCLWDAASALLFQAEAPAGGTCGTGECWNPLGTLFTPLSGYAYRDRDRTPDGLASLRLLRRSDTGLTAFRIRGSGPNLFGRPFGLPSPPLTLPLRVQLQSLDGQCFETTHSTAVMNGAQSFLSRSD